MLVKGPLETKARTTTADTAVIKDVILKAFPWHGIHMLLFTQDSSTTERVLMRFRHMNTNLRHLVLKRETGTIPTKCCTHQDSCAVISLIARFMGPTWGPSGADRPHVGPMLAPWTLLSGIVCAAFCWRWQMWQNKKKTRLCLWNMVVQSNLYKQKLFQKIYCRVLCCYIDLHSLVWIISMIQR